MRKIGVLLAVAAACGGTSATNSSGAQNMSARATLTGSAPPWAKSSSFKGTASSTEWVNVRVYLAWQNQAQLLQLASSVSDPKSASYGKFLTPQQFRAAYAPTQ